MYCDYWSGEVYVLCLLVRKITSINNFSNNYYVYSKNCGAVFSLIEVNNKFFFFFKLLILRDKHKRINCLLGYVKFNDQINKSVSSKNYNDSPLEPRTRRVIFTLK